MILSFEELSQYLFTIGSYRELEGVIASLRELEDNTFFSNASSLTLVGPTNSL